MEHVERQDEREADIRGDIDDLERGGDELEERGKEFEQQVGEARDDWESKQQSADAPGAQDEWGLGVTESHGASDVDPRPGTSENAGAAEGDSDQATGNPPSDDSPAANDEQH